MNKKIFASSLTACLMVLLFAPTAIAGVNNKQESGPVSINHRSELAYNAHMGGRPSAMHGRLTPQQRMQEQQEVQQRMAQQIPQRFRSGYEQMMKRQDAIEQQHQPQQMSQ